MIDWTDPGYQVTPHFSVKDCLWLPHWNRLANESDGLNQAIRACLLTTVSWSEQVRASLKMPMQTTSMYRPPAYSALPEVGGTATDVHTKGVAHDFTVPGMDLEDAKNIIRQILSNLNLRMEKATTDWIHLDSWQVGPSGREFTP